MPVGRPRKNGKQRHGLLQTYYRHLRKEWTTTIIVGLVAISAFFIGMFSGLSINEHPTTVPQYASHPLDVSGQQVDTVETDLTSNSDWAMTFSQDNQGIQFKWSGHGINQNVSVVGFECNIDGDFWFPCGTEFSPVHQPVGEHTFEVRALGNDSSMDNSPAAWVWSVK